MRNLFITLLTFVVFTACQKKQYFSSGPEIDAIKKGNEAFMKGDWTTFRTFYQDTAKIYNNSWDPSKALSPDEFITNQKAGGASFPEMKLGDDTIFEMVVTDEGEKWVHMWALLKSVHKSGAKVDVPIHISFLMAGGKVAFQANFYNELGMYLVEAPAVMSGPETK